jgi:hypothetical protein
MIATWRTARAATFAAWEAASRRARAQALACGLVTAAVLATFAWGAARRQAPLPAAALIGGPSTAVATADSPHSPPAAARARRLATSAHRAALSPRRLRSAPGGLPLAALHPIVGGQRSPGAPGHRPGRRPPGATATNVAAAASPVTVGLVYLATSVTADLDGLLGVRAKPGDVSAQANAVAAWINAHGGVAGRTLKLLPAAYDPSTGGDFPSAFADACTAMSAQTLRPVAVLSPLEDASAQSGCLAGHGLVLIGDAPVPGDHQAFADAGRSLYAPGSLDLDAQLEAEVRALSKDAFLGAASRVGVVRVDALPYARATDRTLRPALARAGATVVAQATVTAVRSPADVPQALADRVIVLDNGRTTPLLMRTADRLGYRPQYGLNSGMDPAALPGEVPAGQLTGARGAGYSPLLDVTPGSEPDAPVARAQCESIYREAGVAVGGVTPEGRFGALSVCDELLTIRSALTGAGEVTPDVLRAALEAPGARRASALTLGTRIDAGHRAGAAATRALAYDGGCGCMRYSGPLETLP